MSKRKRHILISAGPTREAIDPVRYISNHSSGKMGYAIAKAALDLGCKVTLVSGPANLEPPNGCVFKPVVSASEMRSAMIKELSNADVIISVAAVADYRVKKTARHKIKKTADTMQLTLVKNPDILAEMGRKKSAQQILVGFAAETRNALRFGREKLVRKNLDWIVINNVAQKGIGFGSEDNAVTLLSREGTSIPFKKQNKHSLAKKLLKTICSGL